jgi:crotonobetainyl-CoA:carnitine CoA-transferase CaiB-like acyl-CoA transferase
MIMSDLGADVIRVDNVVAPRPTDDQIWAACQRGKRSIALDLKTPEGRTVAQKLIAGADVIHHNMRPGVAERLGVDYLSARSINPRIVYCHTTGFGDSGPMASLPGSDQMAQALLGLEHEQGGAPGGGAPNWYRFGMCDHINALVSVVAVLQALNNRQRTGVGQLVKTSILQASTLFVSGAFLAGEPGKLISPHVDSDQMGLSPFYRIYRTGTDWICVAAVETRQRELLLRACGIDPSDSGEESGQHRWRRLSTVMEAAFLSRPADEWLTFLDSEGVPCELVDPTAPDDWYDEPDWRTLGLVASYEHPQWGRTEQAGTLIHFSATPGRIFGPPVVPGQHSREILDELGYSGSEVEELLSRGITLVPDLGTSH